MDVKTGSGAFMPTHEQARGAGARASSASRTARGCRRRPLLTEMGQCLGHTAGNAVEVAGEHRHAARASRRIRGSREVVLELCGEALALAGLAPDAAAGRARGGGGHRIRRRRGALRRAWSRGLGGPVDLLERHRGASCRGAARARRPCPNKPAACTRSTRGRWAWPWSSSVAAGAMPSHAVDHAVGLTEVRGIGDEVGPDAPLALIHGRDEATVAAAAKRLRDAYMTWMPTGSAAAYDPRANCLTASAEPDGAQSCGRLAAAAIVSIESHGQKRNREHERREALRLKVRRRRHAAALLRVGGLRPGGRLPGAQGPRAPARVPVVLPRAHPRVQSRLGLFPGHEPGRHRAATAAPTSPGTARPGAMAPAYGFADDWRDVFGLFGDGRRQPPPPAAAGRAARPRR